MNTERIYIFFVFSFIGWVIELIFRSVYEKRLVNPGFHKGPWLPLYGITGLMIVFVSSLLGQQSLFIRMVFYFILSTAVELAAGVFLELGFDKRYWDYSENRFNIMGYICPLYSCGWVLICLIVEFFLLGRLVELIRAIPEDILFRIDFLLLLVFSADFFISSGIEQGRTKRVVKTLVALINDNRKHGG
ncbi:MAG: putative ABC transporter permease [Spirochaetales bacterium]|nr:putative ABC transporter permease [Spirochaetales bacterium]